MEDTINMSHNNQADFYTNPVCQVWRQTEAYNMTLIIPPIYYRSTLSAWYVNLSWYINLSTPTLSLRHSDAQANLEYLFTELLNDTILYHGKGGTLMKSWK